MRKIIFVLVMLFSSSALAQVHPPKCDDPFVFVRSYGEWELEGGIWRLPFVCVNGVAAVMKIARENVTNLGYAEYYVEAVQGVTDKTFYYTAPCGGMGGFCEYVSMPREKIPVLNGYN